MEKEKVIALGFFDGVHLGHRALLRRCREEADSRGCTAAALTFDNHPDNLVSGGEVGLLNTAQDRRFLLESIGGMDEVLTLHFDKTMMSMPWEDFVTDVLIGVYHACHVVCGHDFRFGDRGLGTAALLKARCGELGLGCDVIAPVRREERIVSSTYIRALLEKGEMRRAVDFLGHGHLLSGEVVHGRQIGRTMGVPTANLCVPEELLCPRRGVYAGLARWEGKSRPAVINVGMRPTVEGTNVNAEAWLLDFDGDLYGKTLQLSLFHFLRPEKKFGSLEALKAAILENAAETRRLLPTMR